MYLKVLVSPLSDAAVMKNISVPNTKKNQNLNSYILMLFKGSNAKLYPMFHNSFRIGLQKSRIIDIAIKLYRTYFCFFFKDWGYRSTFQQLTLYYLIYYLSLSFLLLILQLALP